MGMNPFAIDLIYKVVEKLPDRPVKMLSLGYPDILLSNEMIERVLGKEAARDLAVRPDSEQIKAWHNMTDHIENIPDSHDFFRRMGVELSVTDFQTVRGDELICDLNKPLPEEFDSQFDLVFDGGTLEHCFNVAQAVVNILGMAKVGGYIIHGNPLVLINHGFYNFSPTFYYDFYVQNGHVLASDIVGTKSAGLSTKVWTLDPIARLPNVPAETAISVIVRKTNNEAPSFPVQTKYLNHPDLKLEGTPAPKVEAK